MSDVCITKAWQGSATKKGESPVAAKDLSKRKNKKK